MPQRIHFAPDHDLLISRFGVMFFDDRLRAFSNMRKALKTGGRFAFLTWRRRAEVEWMRAPLDWIAPELPSPANSDGEIGPFGLADAAATRVLLEEAGFKDVKSDPVDLRLTIGDTLEEAFVMLAVVGPASGLLREAEAEPRSRAEELLRSQLGARQSADGGVHLDAACWLYTGTVG